jgi:hypothetical protein
MKQKEKKKKRKKTRTGEKPHSNKPPQKHDKKSPFPPLSSASL